MIARLLNLRDQSMAIGFCPKWVYSVCTAYCARYFIEKDIPIELVAKKFCAELDEKYHEVNPVEMASIAEDMLRLLAEVDAGEEAINFLTGYIFFTINFESAGKTRTKKLLLGSIFDGDKQIQYNEKEVAKSFRVYMYSLRSGSVPSAPTGWHIDQENDIDFLKEIASKEISIFDAIQD